MAKTAVFCHYFERDTQYRDNLVFFLSAGYREDLDFCIVLSGDCTVALPERPNIHYIAAENRNHDFGGYAAALDALWPMPRYTHFIFVNSSVRGPFFNPDQLPDWTSAFTTLLVGSRHLVGSSATALPDSSHYAHAFETRYGYPGPYWHVQTTAYAMTAEALQHLIDIGFYDAKGHLSKIHVICDYEIRLTQEIRRNGWAAASLLPGNAPVSSGAPNFSAINGDPLFRGGYFGRTLHPRELIFIKTNRNLLSEADLASHTCTALAAGRNGLAWAESEALAQASCARARAAARPGLARRWGMRLRALLRRWRR